MSATPFGRIVTAHDIEQAALSVLRTWAPYYLAEVDRQAGDQSTGQLPEPRSYQVWSERDSWPEHQLPAVIVVSPGTTDPRPERDGTGYRVRWALSVGAVVSASDQHHTRRLAAVYVAALRAVLIQRPALGGLAQGVDWLNEEIVTEDETARTIALGVADFVVDVPAVVDPSEGPAMPPGDPPPPDDPWPAWPDIEHVDASVIHQGDDQ